MPIIINRFPRSSKTKKGGTEFIPSGFGKPYQWKKIKISDTQRYKMCGNAVTVNVVKRIISKLIYHG